MKTIICSFLISASVFTACNGAPVQVRGGDQTRQPVLPTWFLMLPKAATTAS